MSRENLPGEEWRPVPGYEGSYEVSNLGRVYSVRRGPRTGRLLSLDPCGGAYRRVLLRSPGTPGRNWRVHTLVALAFYGPRPAGLEVRHLDGDKMNNRLSNLRYGTRRENMLDRTRHGQIKERCPQGHTYSPENVYAYVNSRGNLTRQCRTCHLARSKARRAHASSSTEAA